MRKILTAIGLWACVGFWSTGCVATRDLVLDAGKDTLRLRNMQTRVFYTPDRERALRDVVATLRDLEFTIGKADATLGVVTGTKQGMRITVTVSSRGQDQVVVRASAQLGLSPVEDPEAYQRFFAALERSMFLTAQQVD